MRLGSLRRHESSLTILEQLFVLCREVTTCRLFLKSAKDKANTIIILLVI